MTDRDLVIAAALSIGARAYSDKIWPGLCFVEEREVWPFYVNQVGSAAEEFNPLDDDGDALRLAVHLGLTPIIDTRYFFETQIDGTGVIEPHGDNPYAATRRAIVRAAAQLA